MKVILKEDVEGLGYLGDLLSVADGYARNFLIPRKKAVLADPRSVKMFEHLKRVASQHTKKELQGLEELGKKIEKVSLTFEVQTGKDDKLFGSVTSKEVGARLAEEGFEIDRRKIQLAQPIKELGTFSIPVKLHRDVVPEFSVSLVKKGGEEVVEEPAEAVEASEEMAASDTATTE